MTKNARFWAFAFYSVGFQAIIWGVFGYAVFIAGRSPNWMLFAFICACCQYTPESFGISKNDAN
jgi:membrane associated rhomboid family serine protease